MARRHAAAHRLFRRPLHGAPTCTNLKARGVGPRAEISMAQRRTTDAAPRPLLLRGRRLETAGQMEAFIKDAVGLHLMGRGPHVNGDLVDGRGQRPEHGHF